MVYDAILNIVHKLCCENACVMKPFFLGSKNTVFQKNWHAKTVVNEKADAKKRWWIKLLWEIFLMSLLIQLIMETAINASLAEDTQCKEQWQQNEKRIQDHLTQQVAEDGYCQYASFALEESVSTQVMKEALIHAIKEDAEQVVGIIMIMCILHQKKTMYSTWLEMGTLEMRTLCSCTQRYERRWHWCCIPLKEKVTLPWLHTAMSTPLAHTPLFKMA